VNLLGPGGRVSQTIFAEMSELAARTGALNLGQGAPCGGTPRSLLQDAAEAVLAGTNQYPPGRGTPLLREAVARHQRDWYGLAVEPEQVVVTAGATEAIAAAVLALCGPGDEVVLIEPAYDAYSAAVALAGARRRCVPLRQPDLRLCPQDLAAAVTERTRMIILNTPHNPTGRVLDEEELAGVAAVALAHDALVLCDEVYEHLLFDGRRHRPLAAFDGMGERTITVSSAGKTFSVTGWKVGWLHAAPEWVEAVTAVKQYLTYTNAAPFQDAVARALSLPAAVFGRLAAELQDRRDLLLEGLGAAGFTVQVPQAGYFVVADAAPLGYADGAALCRRLPGLIGVVGVPMAAFHANPADGGSLVRFAFCQSPQVVGQAAERLATLPARV
jgi:N-succinyldiaminopimelate aminotransferase